MKNSKQKSELFSFNLKLPVDVNSALELMARETHQSKTSIIRGLIVKAWVNRFHTDLPDVRFLPKEKKKKNKP